MRIYRHEQSWRAIFQSNLRSVLVGLVGGTLGCDPELRALPPHGTSGSARVDPEQVRKHVMEGVQDAVEVVGSPIPIAAIEYVPDDSPYYEKYRSLAAHLAMCIAGATMASAHEDLTAAQNHFAQLGERSILNITAAEIERAIRRTGRWTLREEWRISTETEYLVEPAKLDDDSGMGFRAEAFCSFRFSSVSPTVDRALQFLRVYDELIRNLFYWSHFGWPSWMNSREP